LRRRKSQLRSLRIGYRSIFQARPSRPTHFVRAASCACFIFLVRFSKRRGLTGATATFIWRSRQTKKRFIPDRRGDDKRILFRTERAANPNGRERVRPGRKTPRI